MPRLIDADALFDAMDLYVTTVSVCATEGEARGMTRMKQICLEDVQNAPTVDAIPVAWLEELHRKACGEEAADTDLMDLLTNIINIWHYEQGRKNDEQG